MPTAYSLIPPDRPATEDELVELYKPVVNWWANRIHYDPLRTRDDIVQDAYLGLLHAWRSWRPDGGSSFKSWAVKIVGQWVRVKGLAHFGLNLQRAYQQDNLRERMAVLQPLSLDQSMEELDDYLSFLVDERAENEFKSLFALSFDDMVGLLENEQNDRARYVLTQVFREGRIYDDVGTELGISRQRVEQIVRKACLKIKRRLLADAA